MSDDPNAPAAPATPTTPASEPAAPAAPPAPAVEDWRAELPEEVRSHALVTEAKDVAALARQAIDLQAYQGSSIRIPSEHASAEDQQAFREKLRQHVPNLIEADLTDTEAQRELQRRMGLPEEAAGYVRPEFELPEGVDLDYSMLDTFQPLAHEAGLTQGQFNTIVEKFTAANVEAATAARQQHIQGMEALHKEWGYAFDSKMSAAKVGAKVFADAGLEVFAGDDLTVMGASTLRALAEVGSRLGGEGSSLEKDPGGAATTHITPAEAKRQRQEMLSNTEHPMWDRSHPAHDTALAEYRKLTALMLGPEGQKDHAVATVVGDPSELPGAA